MNTTNRHGSATVELVGDREILITRQFDAPARLVFKAYTTAEYVRRWWGFETSEWVECSVDLRVGGRWRYVTRETRDGHTFDVAFHGDYQEIEAPSLIVTTEVYEPYPDAGAVDTIRFVEADGVTTMTVLVRHQEPAHRDMHIGSGMEGGMQISMDRMEDLIATW